MRNFDLLSTSTTKETRWHLCLDYYWAFLGFSLLPAAYVEVRAFSFLDKDLMVINDIYSGGSLELWTKWIIVKAASFSVFYLFVLLLKLIFRASNISELKARHLFVVGFAGGGLVGLVQLFLVRVLGIYDTGSSFGRIFAPVPTFTFVLIALSTLHTSIASYKFETNEARSALDALKNLRTSQERILIGYKNVSDELRLRVKGKADEALARVAEIDRAQILGNSNIANEIRLISDSTIRDLSHKIAFNYREIKKQDGFNLFGSSGFSIVRLIGDSAQFAPLDPLRFTIACALIVSGMMIRNATFPEALVIIGVGFGLVYASQLAGQLIFKRLHIHNIYTIVIVTLMSCLLPYQVIPSTTLIRNNIPDWNTWRPTPLPFFFIVVFVSVVGYLMQGGSLERDELVRLRDAEITRVQHSGHQINTELVEISRNWARHLHGHVQSQILAATLLLEDSQRDGNFASVQEAFDLILRTLENASEYEYFDDESLRDGLDKQISLWSEIIDISLTMPPVVSVRTGPQIRRAVEVVGEMITNASRHGGASRIKIEISRENPNELQIKAVDNGSKFVAQSKGFGTRFFDEVSRGRWDIARNKVIGETTVSVLIDLPDIDEFEPSVLPLETAV